MVSGCLADKPSEYYSNFGNKNQCIFPCENRRMPIVIIWVSCQRFRRLLLYSFSRTNNKANWMELCFHLSFLFNCFLLDYVDPLKDPKICGRPQCDMDNQKFVYKRLVRYQYNYESHVRTEFNGPGQNTSDLFATATVILTFPKNCEGAMQINDVKLFNKMSSDSEPNKYSDNFAYEVQKYELRWISISILLFLILLTYFSFSVNKMKTNLDSRFTMALSVKCVRVEESLCGRWILNEAFFRHCKIQCHVSILISCRVKLTCQDHVIPNTLSVAQKKRVCTFRKRKIFRRARIDTKWTHFFKRHRMIFVSTIRHGQLSNRKVTAM